MLLLCSYAVLFTLMTFPCDIVCLVWSRAYSLIEHFKKLVRFPFLRCFFMWQASIFNSKNFFTGFFLLLIHFISCLIVVITGPNRSGVVGARSRIEVIVESSRQKIPFTHFLCFPLYKSNLAKKVDEFKVRVLKDCFEVTYSTLSYCFWTLYYWK